jgi:hypothetical protein
LAQALDKAATIAAGLQSAPDPTLALIEGGNELDAAGGKKLGLSLALDGDDHRGSIWWELGLDCWRLMLHEDDRPAL